MKMSCEKVQLIKTDCCDDTLGGCMLKAYLNFSLASLSTSLVFEKLSNSAEGYQMVHKVKVGV